LFKLVITSIDELTAFVSIIQGHRPNDEEIKRLTHKLNQSTEILKEAVEKETHDESRSS
jgi:hypothetical protein